MKKRFYGLLISLFLLFSVFASAQVQTPTGTPITVPQLLGITQSVGGFLIIFGGILAALTVIISGLVYMFAGSSQQRVTAAKNMLIAGLIGALIIFGVGVIINIIKSVAQNPLGFF